MEKKPSRLKKFFSRSSSSSSKGDGGSAKASTSSWRSSTFSPKIDAPPSTAALTIGASSERTRANTAPTVAPLDGGTITPVVEDGDTAGGKTETMSLWEEALESLSKKERDVFSKVLQNRGEDNEKTATDKSGSESAQSPAFHIDEVLRICQKRRDICQEKRYRFKVMGQTVELRAVADRMVSWLDTFKQIGDVAVNSDPLHAGLPWAGIRFLLQMATTEKDQMEALLTGMERVLYVLDRCKVYEQLYLQDSEGKANIPEAQNNLRNAVVVLYSEILAFLATAMATFEKSGTARFFEAAWSASFVAEFGETCRELESRADIEASNCERAAGQDSRRELRRDIRQLKKLLEELKTAKSLSEEIDERTNLIWNKLTLDTRSEILRWVSQIPYKDNHRMARENRTAHTGEWILQHEVYRQWETSEESTTLWLHGIPGAGKTKLVSKVIDTLLERQGRNTAVAYFYCDRNQEERRKPEVIMRTFVKQLAISCLENDTLHQSLVQLYESRKSEGFSSEALSYEECEELMVRMSESYFEVYLVLDALDESIDDREQRQRFMESFEKLVERISRLKIFISSRRDHDIKQQLEKESNVGIEASDNMQDIKRYVSDELAKDNKRRRIALPDDLKQEILRVFVAKSDGMFQWTVLHIKQLIQLERPVDIRKRLISMPQGLKGTYDEIYQRIKARNDSRSVIALRAFKWLIASSDFTPEMLVEAVAQDPKADAFAEIDFDIDFVLDACRNLVILDRHTNIVRLGHLSVREYLIHVDELWSDLYSYTATICLRYLLDQKYWIEYDISESLEALTEHLSDFVIHTKTHWGFYLSLCDGKTHNCSPRVSDLAKRFLGSWSDSSLAYRNWVRFHYLSDPSVPSLFKPSKISSFAAVYFEIVQPIVDWWKNDKSIIHHINRLGETTLQIAIEHNSRRDVEELLLNAGADPNAHTSDARKNCSALIAAIRCRASYSFPRLLERGASPNTVQTEYLCSAPLAAAVYSNAYTMFKALIKGGADVHDTSDDLYGSALIMASVEFDVSATCILLEAGANMNECMPPGKLYDSPLVAMIANMKRNLRIEAVRRERANLPPSSLDEQGMLDIYLYEFCADPQVTTKGPYGSALAAAAHHGLSYIAQYLLDMGIDVNTPLEGKYGSVLVALLSKSSSDWDDDSEEILDTLLDRNVDVNAMVGGYFGSALAAAAASGNGLNKILAAGANINTPVPRFGRVLNLAAFEGASYSVGVLLNAGSEVNFVGGIFRTALNAAVYNGDHETVVILLERGANPAIPHIKGSNLLRLAVYRQHHDLIPLLIAHMASKGMQVDDIKKSCLELAEAIGNVYVSSLLQD